MWRRSPLPKGWDREIRPRILERDGHRCTVTLADGTRCRSRATDVHHIGSEDDHRDKNLTSVCGWHHKRFTSTKANATRRRISQHRESESHPGLKG